LAIDQEADFIRLISRADQSPYLIMVNLMGPWGYSSMHKIGRRGISSSCYV